MTTLYATVADLQSVLSSTDSGIGTPAQLSTAQLTLALTTASNRISVYGGQVWDSSNPQAVPPPILHDLCLDLAAFWAWKTYLKGKIMPTAHPAFIAYTNAQDILNQVRDGKIRLDPQVVGSGVGEETALIINRIPPIFTGADSNTHISQGGFLEPDIPFGQWTPNAMDWQGGPVYQG